MSAETSPQQATRLVWDLPLRVFHWLLVLSVTASWLSGQLGYDYRPLHMWLGYWMLGLIGFRVVWGLVGPRHSRFVSFAPRPRILIDYVKRLRDGSATEGVGHNPLGGLMVFVMLLILGAQAVSGLFLFDDILYAGPWHAAVSGKTAEMLNDLHHSLVNIILALVALHVAAILFYTLRKKQRLVRAMWNGHKDAAVVSSTEAIRGSRLWLAIAVVACVAGFVYWLVAVAPDG